MDDPLALAERAARLKDYRAAEAYCNAHLDQFPADKRGLRLLAFLYALDRNYERAVEVVSDVIAQSDQTPEPSDYFDRGRWLVESGHFLRAVDDFSTVIELSGRCQDDYYLESAHLCRANASVQLGSMTTVKEDLSQVGGECQTFALGRLFSKSSLLLDQS